jgi:hypothetical protein
VNYFFHLPNYRFFSEVHQWTLVSIKGNMAFTNGLEILLLFFFVCAKFCIVSIFQKGIFCHNKIKLSKKIYFESILLNVYSYLASVVGS